MGCAPHSPLLGAGIAASYVNNKIHYREESPQLAAGILQLSKFLKIRKTNQLTQNLIILLISLIVIVVASEIFTNAIESLGAKLKFSEGVTGSIFAAVGTAL